MATNVSGVSVRSLDAAWFDAVSDEMEIAHVYLSSLKRERTRVQRTINMTPVTMATLIARTVKYMREQCGRTQAQLAADMERLGFVSWKRITVAETESAKRRPTWEELIGLCVLFGTSPEGLLLEGVKLNEAIVLNERRVVTYWEYAKLIAPNRAEPHDWDSDIEASALAGASIADIAAAEEDWRPIAEYQRRLRQSEIARYHTTEAPHPAAQAENETS